MPTFHLTCELITSQPKKKKQNFEVYPDLIKGVKGGRPIDFEDEEKGEKEVSFLHPMKNTLAKLETGISVRDQCGFLVLL